MKIDTHTVWNNFYDLLFFIFQALTIDLFKPTSFPILS